MMLPDWGATVLDVVAEDELQYPILADVVTANMHLPIRPGFDTVPHLVLIHSTQMTTRTTRTTRRRRQKMPVESHFLIVVGKSREGYTCSQTVGE